VTNRPPATPPRRLHAPRRGSGPRIVLVHGFTQSAASFEPVARALAGSHEVVTPDLPGHGRSPAAAGGLESAAAELASSCGRATYVGYSLGGRVCLQLALDHPDVVERLVLVSTTAGIEDLDERAERAGEDEQLARRIEEGGDRNLPAFLDEWLAGPLFAHLSDEAAGRPARLVNTAAGLASSLRAHGTGAMLPLWERLGELGMPVVVVAGADDAKFASLARRLAAATRSSSLVLVPGAGHAVPFEQPEAFARLVAGVIAGAPPPAGEPGGGPGIPA
jgi:2-succinyl-6-hydroxy-2,4-cyclohexadiene-1-carboxylate synthase